LQTTVYPGELSDSVVQDEGIPITNDNQRDYIVPLNLLQSGWITFQILFPEGYTGVLVEDLELKLFREDN
jgi:hypothetical protein